MAETMHDRQRQQRNIRLTAVVLALFAAGFYLFVFLKQGA